MVGRDAASLPVTTISLTFGDSGNASGNGGVNGYSVSYTADPGAGTLTFGQIAATLMTGPTQFMTDEDRYFTSLANVTGYKLTDGSLVLLDKDGHTLLTFTTPLKNTAWSLVSYTASAASAAAQPLALITLTVSMTMVRSLEPVVSISSPEPGNLTVPD